MSTTIRPALSYKNKYWIEKHRYYELKHFCLQYPGWKRDYMALDGLKKQPHDLSLLVRTNVISDPTARCAEAKLFYSERMELVERVAYETDRDLHSYILKAVTEGLSFETLKTQTDIPCCRDVYYDLYRRFFWLLNRARGWPPRAEHSPLWKPRQYYMKELLSWSEWLAISEASLRGSGSERSLWPPCSWAVRMSAMDGTSSPATSTPASEAEFQ